MRYPDPDDHPDDADLLRHIVTVYGARTLHAVGGPVLSGYPVPPLPMALTRALGEAGLWLVEEDLRALLSALDRPANLEALRRHGLVGPQLRFKAACLAEADARLYALMRDGRPARVAAMTVGGIVDKVIDSALEATGAGVGIREIGDIASDVIGGTLDG